MSRGWHILSLTLMPLATLAAGCYGPASEQEKALLGASEIQPAPCITPEDEERLADEILELVNLQRAAAGIAPVVSENRLEGLSRDYACTMIGDGFFGHYDPETGRGPGQRAVAAGYQFVAVGETLAIGDAAGNVMRAWMQSDPHREVILDPQWSEIGVGVRAAGQSGTYWVLEFGDPAPTPTPSEA